MKKYLIGNCKECGRFHVIARDGGELIYSLAKNNDCVCGAHFGKFKDGFWNLEVEEISSPYLEDELGVIADNLKEFMNEFPNSTEMAFIMMKIPDESFNDKQTDNNDEILNSIQNVLKENGFIGLRADYKEYADDLLPNIMTYMEGCNFGIAVFDEIGQYNPNVSLETGYMLSSGKPVCILKDRTVKKLPADIISKLYKEFDSNKPYETIKPELEDWLKTKIINH